LGAGCAKKLGNQTRTPKRLSIMASRVAARRGRTPKRSPRPAAAWQHEPRPAGKPRRHHCRRIRRVGEMGGAVGNAGRAEKNPRHLQRAVTGHHGHRGRAILAAQQSVENPCAKQGSQGFEKTVPRSDNQGLEEEGMHARGDPDKSVHPNNQCARRGCARKEQAGARAQQDRPRCICQDRRPGMRGMKRLQYWREVAVDQAEYGEACHCDSEQGMAESRYPHAEITYLRVQPAKVKPKPMASCRKPVGLFHRHDAE
jgi:hypothetical protein